MKRLAIFAVIVTCFSIPLPAQETTSSTSLADKKVNEKPTSYWMEKKLEYTQGILRSLATGDLDELKTYAERLQVLNRVEGFVRRKNPQYKLQLSVFNHVSADLVKQAEADNIDGAALAFNQLTVSCVQCHKSLRAEDASSSPKGKKSKN